MKKLIFFFLIVFTMLFSCKKEKIEYHKITYEIENYNGAEITPANYFLVQAQPSSEQFSAIDRNSNTKLERVEYWGLKNGDKVLFGVTAKLNYWFSMRIYIDDLFVSEREVKMSDYSYQAVSWYKQNGINNYEGTAPIIEFIYP
jgi:hypothetical protein